MNAYLSLSLTDLLVVDLRSSLAYFMGDDPPLPVPSKLPIKILGLASTWRWGEIHTASLAMPCLTFNVVYF